MFGNINLPNNFQKFRNKLPLSIFQNGIYEDLKMYQKFEILKINIHTLKNIIIKSQIK